MENSIKLLSFAGILGIIYMTWAIGNFFEERKFGNYAKALVAILLGTITFYIIIFTLGISIDIITKH